MFFLFGWGHQKIKDYGATLPLKCPNCHNDSFWRLAHSTVWFTLFFIPIFPYKSTYHLLCPVCSKGIQLERLRIDKAKQLTQATLSFLDKKMTEDEYKTALGEIRLLE